MSLNFVKMLNEEKIIKLAQKYFKGKNKNLIKGIGDDTAVFLANKKYQLITSDMLVEKTHFLLDSILPYQLGWKSLAVNISDIAAMGGIPEYATLSIGIKPNTTTNWLEEFYKGMSECAKTYNVNVIGGDTVSAKDNLVISIALNGSTEKPIYRDKIKTGYLLTTTGFLGLSGVGLHLILNKNEIADEFEVYCIKKHYEPIPRIKEGLFLNQHLDSFSMMDCSDGLYSSAKTMSKLSKLGIELYEDNFPKSDFLIKACEKHKLSTTEKTLYGGEDYELIFALSEESFNYLKPLYYKKFNFELPLLGRFNDKHKKVILIGGNKKIILSDKSYKHF